MSHRSPLRSAVHEARLRVGPFLKRQVMRTSLVGAARVVRDRMSLLGTAYRHPELLGMLSNDQLAGSLITQLCQPGGMFLDVGAHLGLVIAAALRRANMEVAAIEAVEEKAAFLRARFPNVHVYHCAAGPVDGETAFFVDRKQSAYSSLGKPGRSAPSEITEVRIPMRALDSLFENKVVGAIKIDVEGGELGVLRGASALIARCRPAVMFESGPPCDDGLGYTKEALWQWFAERDYGIYVPNRVAHDGVSLSLDGFTESHQYPRRTTDYFALPRERRVEFRDRARTLPEVRKQIPARVLNAPREAPYVAREERVLAVEHQQLR
jgi:FkbM family methyltransferase